MKRNLNTNDQKATHVLHHFGPRVLLLTHKNTFPVNEISFNSINTSPLIVKDIFRVP